MKRKHHQINVTPWLPDEILCLILSFVPYGGSNWLNCRLASKKFLVLCKIAQDPSVNNNYAIKWALDNKHFDVARELLKDKRVDPSVHEKIIHYPLICDQVDLVKDLISRPGIESLYCSEDAEYSLLGSAMENRRIITALELVKDFRIPLTLRFVTHPLQLAALYGYWQLIKPILDRPDMKEADVGSYSEVLFEAVKQDNWLVVRALLAHTNADPSKGYNCIIKAVKKGYKNTLKELMKHPNARYTEYALRCAMDKGHLEIAKEILETGCCDEDLPSCDRAYVLLSETISSGNIELVKYILPTVSKEKLREEYRGGAATLDRTIGTGEIETAILDHADMFEKYAAEIAVVACGFGRMDSAMFLMKNPKFVAAPEQMKYLTQALQDADLTL